MLISWKHKFLFVHIPKTGGTSLIRAFLPYSRPLDRLSRGALSVPGLRRLLVYGARGANPMEYYSGLHAHETIKAAVEKLGEEKILPLTRFAFIRNPFTHAYSIYSHARRFVLHPLHKEFNNLTFQGALEKYYLKGAGAQLPYVRNVGGEVYSLDFIGRFERLSKDASRLATQLGLPGRFNIPVTNVNPTPPVALREEFGIMLDRFIEAKADEFSYFGYSTDIEKAGEPPGSPPAKRIRPAAQWD